MTFLEQAKRREGMTLIETVISVALFGIVALGLTAGLSTGLLTSVDVEHKAVSQDVATSQLENTLDRAYVEPPAYPSVSPPSGYTVSNDNSVLTTFLLQRIKASISSPEKSLLDLVTHKVNLAYYPPPPGQALAQRDYRWYQNANDLTPSTALAAENTPFNVVQRNQAYRLRFSIQAEEDFPGGVLSLKLQYAGSADGPWTDLGAAGSAETWRSYDNAAPADGASLPSALLSSSSVAETYEEGNPSASNPNPISSGQVAEWDWTVQDNGAAYSTNYYFRMVKSDGTPLFGYFRNAVIITPPPTSYAQYDYRWAANADSLTPPSPLAGEHTPYTSTARSVVYRLRMNLTIDGSEMSAGAQAFKLQFATSTSGPWSDIGGPGSGTEWRGYDNPTPADGATLSSLILSTSTVAESYEEENPSSANPSPVPVGGRGEWDWVIEENGAVDGQPYYFRMARSDGTPLESYTYYPTLTVSPPAVPAFRQQDYRWYQNADSITPTVPLAAENTSYSASALGVVYRLRMNVEVDYYSLPATSQSFKLQYATSTSGPWTDVAAAGSGSTWRGYDNPTPPDGNMISALRLTNSVVLQSYEEENPSVANPTAMAIGENGEWDWVVYYGGIANGTTYYFRMAKSDGSALDAYSRYAQMTVPLIVSLAQQDHRWYQNTNGITPTTPLAAENAAYSGAVPATVYRLRMNVQAGNTALTPGAQAFKLQYSTSTAGPWADVGDVGAVAIWRGYNNSTPADGAAITSSLLTTSSVLETYEEANPSAANPNAINNGQYGEWDWVLQNGGAPGGTTYYFRMVKSDDTALDTYARYPQVTTGALTYAQDYYRWYQNRNNQTPTTALAAENTAYSGAALGTVYRLRLNVLVGASNLGAGGQAFKLQFSTDTGGPWTDVGGLSSAEAWRGYNNSSPADGATLSTSLLSNTNVRETYEEANPSAYNPTAVNSGQRAEYDWVLQNNGAAGGTAYYFRMVRSDGSALDTYNRYAQVTTVPLTYTQDYYRWYQNANSVTPTTPLAGENTAYTAGAMGQVYRLRVNVLVGTSNLPSGTQAFKLQYSTAAGGPWADVGAVDSAEIWRGYNNTTPADGATLATNLLSNSNVSETYEEGNPSALNPNAVNAGQRAEYDWVLQENGAAFDTPYYFRVVRTDGSVLNTYNRYPQLTTPPNTTYHQRDYRWYQNADSLTPTTALASQDSPYTATTPSLTYRLRLNVEVTGLGLSAAGQAFKLQYSTSADGPWTDVGAMGSVTIWRGYDNVTPTDGATLASLLLSTSNVLESYEEENPSASNPNPISIGQKAEWDWVLQDNNANPSTTYYFRAVQSDGTAFATYTNYPELTTAAVPTFTEDEYRWYENVDGLDPATALAAEDTPFTAASAGQTYRLRINVLLGGNSLPAGAAAFKLQYATSTGGPWSDVGALGSVAVWRGYNNPSPADGATLGSLKLSSSTVAESYVEANPSPANPASLIVGDRAEWDWVLQENSAPSATTYYFRMVKSDGTPFTSYLNYPQLTTAITWTLAAWDDFESAGFSGGAGWLDAWTHVGTPNVTTEGLPYQGTYHARLRRNNDRMRRATDLFGRAGARIRVWVKATSFEPGETAALTVSSDGGSTWGTAYTWTDAVSDDTYHYYDIDLSSFSLTSTFWLSFDANMGDVNDFFYFDDIQVEAY